MRKSVISSSVTTIVAQVNDCLVVAGVALRTLLAYTLPAHAGYMRERCRGWQEPRIAMGSHPFGLGSSHAAKHPWAGLKQSQQCAFAYCPAHAAIARFASRG